MFKLLSEREPGLNLDILKIEKQTNKHNTSHLTKGFMPKRKRFPNLETSLSS